MAYSLNKRNWFNDKLAERYLMSASRLFVSTKKYNGTRPVSDVYIKGNFNLTVAITNFILSQEKKSSKEAIVHQKTSWSRMRATSLVFIVAAGLLASAWPEARNYDYESKFQKYLDKIAEIKKGNSCMYTCMRRYCYL